MCVCARVCTGAHTCMLRILIYCSSPYSLEIGFLTELGAKLVASRPQSPSCPHPDSVGVYKHMYSYAQHYLFIYLFRFLKLLNSKTFSPIFHLCAMHAGDSHHPLLDPLPFQPTLSFPILHPFSFLFTVLGPRQQSQLFCIYGSTHCLC